MYSISSVIVERKINCQSNQTALCWLVLIQVRPCDNSEKGRPAPPPITVNKQTTWDRFLPVVNKTPTWLNLVRRERKKGLTGNWTQDLSQILYYPYILRKNHTARPSGHVEWIFGFIYYHGRACMIIKHFFNGAVAILENGCFKLRSTGKIIPVGLSSLGSSLRSTEQDICYT